MAVLATYHKIFVHGYPADNNLKTFLASYGHLINNLDMYLEYPAEHGDQFKYTPTFGLYVWPLTHLPYLLAAVLFSLFNLAVFVLGVWRLPIKQSDKNIFLWAALPELAGAIQNFQTNGMISGFFLLSYSFFLGGKQWSAVTSIAVAFFTKIFSAALLTLGWAVAKGPRERWRYVGVVGLVFGFFFILPAFFVGFDNLLAQYSNYARLQGSENTQQPIGYYSIMHIVSALSGMPIRNIYFQLIGALLVAAPLLTSIGHHLWKRIPQALFASAVLFMLVFNHRTESETFIIGMTGFLVWWVAQPRNGWTWFLFIFNFVCVSALYGDLFLTAEQKILYLEPIYIKIWGILIVWFIVQFQIWREWSREVFKKVSSVQNKNAIVEA
jgi:hypothetical protein